MAVNVNVNISFETTSAGAAQEAIDSWQLTPDCVVVATVSEVVIAGMVDESGTILQAPSPEDEEANAAETIPDPTVEEHIDGSP